MISRREGIELQKRVWIRSGIIEVLDERQARLLALVYEKIRFYYGSLYGTRPCYAHPLSLWRLRKLCNRSHRSVLTALHYLSNTVPFGTHDEPPVYYERIQASRNKSHRPYRIFLRKKRDSLHT